MERILVVEDVASLREVLCAVLTNEGFFVQGCGTYSEGLNEILSKSWSCVLSDFKLPEKNGIELLKETRGRGINIPFIIMTAYGSIEVAVEAIKNGATDFICKPFEPECLAPMLRSAISQKRIVDRTATRKAKNRPLLSDSPQMRKLLDQAELVARVDSSILIWGESGTGKEILAKYIHDKSPRSDKPFVAVNCAAFPKELLESEFFGHEAGAFTGATQARAGIFECAADGTIFLDEIGDMCPSLQVKLLRALQEREIRRVGSTKSVRVNPRVIAATNKDPGNALMEGCLREDLYYRLAVMTFRIPPLRERKSDIRLLANYFVESISGSLELNGVSLSEVAIEFLEHYGWPGNIRELENIIERAIVLGAKEIRPEHLGINPGLNLDALNEASRTLPEITAEAVKQAEVHAINNALMITDGNKTKAAVLLGISYKTLFNKIKEYNMEEKEKDEGLATPA